MTLVWVPALMHVQIHVAEGVRVIGCMYVYITRGRLMFRHTCSACGQFAVRHTLVLNSK